MKGLVEVFNSVVMNIVFSRLLDFLQLCCARLCAVIVLLTFCLLPAFAGVDTFEFNDVRQEAQYQALIEELRCPTCQNQSLASSNSPIALSLKQLTYEMVMAGETDDAIKHAMMKRYGDYIVYKPPLNKQTSILWIVPPLLLIMMLGVWFYHHRQQDRLLSDIDDASAQLYDE